MKACACVQARTPVTRVTMPMPPGVLTAKVKCDQGLVGPERCRQRCSALLADPVPCHITRPPSGPGPPRIPRPVPRARRPPHPGMRTSRPAPPPRAACASLVSAGACVSGHARLHLHPHPRPRVRARRASGQHALREGDTRPRPCVQPRTPSPRASMPMPPGVLTSKIEHSQGRVDLERRRQRFSALLADAVVCNITRPPSGPGPLTPALSLAPAALRTQACAHPALAPLKCHRCTPCVRRCMCERG